MIGVLEQGKDAHGEHVASGVEGPGDQRGGHAHEFLLIELSAPDQISEEVVSGVVHPDGDEARQESTHPGHRGERLGNGTGEPSERLHVPLQGLPLRFGDADHLAHHPGGNGFGEDLHQIGARSGLFQVVELFVYDSLDHGGELTRAPNREKAGDQLAIPAVDRVIRLRKGARIGRASVPQLRGDRRDYPLLARAEALMGEQFLRFRVARDEPPGRPAVITHARYPLPLTQGV
ncbi:hypothetical protein ACFQ10_47400 [Streptomyces indonesiensis]